MYTRWEVWRPRYESIVKRLGLDPSADAEVARVLNDLLPEPDLDGIASILHGRECVVLGAGPSLDED
ncbi:MAG: 6-hydroxymethyl-7,8-dihydropterin pyrophosphokinase, partial [Hadesarchaea archaeon]|nr:6-hydroxymethyl-7,8-dihydropterin pyrophosphokinase [Hadesarchaea archaeon]